VKKDDRVAIIAENCPEWVVADMGIVALGAVDVPIYPALTPPQIAYILNDSGARIVVVSAPSSSAKSSKYDHIRSRSSGSFL